MIVSIDEIISYFDKLKKDYEKFVNKNNKAAGKRIRKYLLSLMKLSKEGRKEISSRINNMSKKKQLVEE